MLKLIIPAVVMSFFTVASAGAMPAMAPVGAGAAADIGAVQQVQYRHDRRDSHRRPPHRPRYAPGSRQRMAPHGWRRYGARPGDWRTRGCIVVGPAWFCP